MQGSPPQTTRSGTVARWVPLALFGGVLLFCGVFYWREAVLVEQSARDLERARVEMFVRLFQNELQAVTAELRALANVDSLQTYFATGNPAELDRAARRAVMFSRLHPEYDQIRFLDVQGRELMRIDPNGRIAPAAELQDKKDRPYFQKSSALTPGQIYISVFDLNTEAGRVEVPFKPTLRLATPVFDAAGQPRGVFVINYLGDRLFARMYQLRPDLHSNLRALNAQGYWLKADQPDQEWGFMLPERNHLTLARQEPDLWARMLAEPQGAARRSTGSLLNWGRVNLRQSLKERPDMVVAEDGFLILASEMSGAEFAALFGSMRLVFGILTTLLLVSAFVVYRLLGSRQQAHARLRRSEENLAVTLHSIGDAVLATDPQRRITRLNPVAEKLTGWTEAEAIGRPVEEVFRIIQEDTRLPAVIPVDDVLATGEIHGLANHTALIARDGTERPIADSAAPIRDAAGKILGVVLVFRDVTEERRAQQQIQRLNESLEQRVSERTAELARANEALRQSEHRFRALIEHGGDSIAVIDAANNILYLSPAVAAVEGYTAEELMGHNGLENTHPDDLPLIHETVQQLLANPGKPIPIVWRRRHKQGHWLWLEGVATNLLDDPAVGGIVTNYRDVTERKLATKQEAAFAKLGQSLSEVASPDAAARQIADVAGELLGWDACSLDVYVPEQDLAFPIINIDTVEGKRMDVPPAYGGQPPSVLARTILEKGAQLILREGTPEFAPGAMPFGDRSRPSASLMYVPIRRGQKAIGILSIQSYTPKAYDAKALNLLQTLADQCGGALERVRAEAMVRELNEHLEQRVIARTAELAAANKELESFSYSVSHDLRAPLRHIDGFVGMLKPEAEAKLSPGGQRFLQIISQSAKRMGVLIDDLLVFSRFGRTEIRATKVAMAGLVAEAVHEMAADLKGRPIEWDIAPLPEAMGDRTLLKQVWVNLLANAVKYTRQRNPAKIQVRGKKNDRDEWEFSVRDNGAGFAMQYAGKLFGVFQRLHSNEEFEGTGIGLANVHRIIVRHGGRVWAEGKVNEGATFYFALPNERNKV